MNLALVWRCIPPGILMGAVHREIEICNLDQDLEPMDL